MFTVWPPLSAAYIPGVGSRSRVGCQAAGCRLHISLHLQLHVSRPAPAGRLPPRPAVTPGFVQHSRYADSPRVLGIEVDMAALTLRLPDNKLQCIIELLTRWLGRSSGTRRDLEFLIGVLQHACSVVHSRRLFLRRVYDLLARKRFKPHYFICLNAEYKVDIEWWCTFVSS